VLEKDGQFWTALECPNRIPIHFRESLGKGRCLAGREPFPGQKAGVASKEFMILRCPGSHGEIPRVAKKFSRISMLPRQGKAHFCGDGGHEEGRPEYSVQDMGRIFVVRAQSDIGPGKSLIRVTDGVSLICPYGHRQGDREDEGGERPQRISY